jgi:Tyrosine phosphatase family
MSYQDEYEDLLAPENFAMVEAGVYRSAFPRSKNIPFLRSLRLRAVVALIPEDYPVHMTDFYEQCGVKLISHGLDGNKWPFKEIDEIGTELCYVAFDSFICRVPSARYSKFDCLSELSRMTII